jgi:hypothetical protein
MTLIKIIKKKEDDKNTLINERTERNDLEGET